MQDAVSPDEHKARKLLIEICEQVAENEWTSDALPVEEITN